MSYLNTPDRQPNHSAAPASLPLASMVRALCQAATAGPDQLYEVMIKLTLMVDATAQTYGLATWAQRVGERPRLKWVEGLKQEEIADAEIAVAEALGILTDPVEIKAGDRHMCMVLATPSVTREGTAIYGRCVRPLTDRQARELRLLSDVARLAHSHVALLGDQPKHFKPHAIPAVADATLPGMVFISSAM